MQKLTEPALSLSPEVLSVFQETLLSLRRKIEYLGMEAVQEKTCSISTFGGNAKASSQICRQNDKRNRRRNL